MNYTLEHYLINVGIRSAEYTYSDETLFDNIDYFRCCYEKDMSAYKALLFLYDYLEEKMNKTDANEITEESFKEIQISGLPANKFGKTYIMKTDKNIMPTDEEIQEMTMAEAKSRNVLCYDGHEKIMKAGIIIGMSLNKNINK
jgi:hypothetical protein